MKLSATDKERPSEHVRSGAEYRDTAETLHDWRASHNKNVCIIGGSGSGKTRYFVKPNLIQMHSSYVITDPKGTLYDEMVDMFERGGYKV